MRVLIIAARYEVARFVAAHLDLHSAKDWTFVNDEHQLYGHGPETYVVVETSRGMSSAVQLLHDVAVARRMQVELFDLDAASGVRR